MKKLLISLFLLSSLSGCTLVIAPKLGIWDKIKEVIDFSEREPEVYRPLYDIDVALDYLGYHENDNREELEQLLRVDPVRVPWCAAFVNAILRENDIPDTGSFLARSYLDWGISVDDPQYGDILVFERGTEDWQGHVGFYIGKYEKDDIEYYMVLGGNQNDSVTIQYYSTQKLIDIRRYLGREN